MKLFTAEIKKKLPLVSEITDIENAPIIVKFFGGGSYTLYVIGADVILKDQDEPVRYKDVTNENDIEDILLYGYVTGLHEDEWGTTSFNELKAIRFPPFNLTVERDKYFGMNRTMKEIKDNPNLC